MTMHTRTNHPQHVPTGVFFAMLGSLSFTVMSLFCKLLEDRVSTSMILFARFSTSLLLILPWAIKYPKQTLTLRQPIKILLRSTLTLLNLACFFYALRYLPLANSLLFLNTSPLFIPLILLLLHQIKTPHKMWIGIILGFVGIVMVLQPSASASIGPSLVGLSSGIIAAAAIITIRFMTKAIPLLQILFYNFFIGTVASSLLLPFAWHPLDGEILLLLLGVGVFGSLYYFLSTISYAKAPVRITSSLSFLSIILGVCADWIIWHISPDWLSLVGILAVILGGMVTIYYGQKELIVKN